MVLAKSVINALPSPKRDRPIKYFVIVNARREQDPTKVITRGNDWMQSFLEMMKVKYCPNNMHSKNNEKAGFMEKEEKFINKGFVTTSFHLLKQYQMNACLKNDSALCWLEQVNKRA